LEVLLEPAVAVLGPLMPPLDATTATVELASVHGGVDVAGQVQHLLEDRGLRLAGARWAWAPDEDGGQDGSAGELADVLDLSVLGQMMPLLVNGGAFLWPGDHDRQDGRYWLSLHATRDGDHAPVAPSGGATASQHQASLTLTVRVVDSTKQFAVATYRRWRRTGTLWWVRETVALETTIGLWEVVPVEQTGPENPNELVRWPM
jgi:hypothetical protein